MVVSHETDAAQVGFDLWLVFFGQVQYSVPQEMAKDDREDGSPTERRGTFVLDMAVSFFEDSPFRVGWKGRQRNTTIFLGPPKKKHTS